MNNNDPDNSPGAELRRLASPKLAAQLRRRTLIGSLILLVAGIVALVDGVHGMRTGELVKIGGYRNGFEAPWWMSVLLGVFVIALGIWTAWPESKRRR